MKILLINPPGPFARAGSRWPHRSEGGFGYAPFPFWLASLASVLIKEGFQADLKDCIALGWSNHDLISFTSEFKPDLVIMETSAPSFGMDIDTLKDLNLKVPSAAIGFHATALPKEHLKGGFDYAIQGEYELSSLNLAGYLAGTKSFPEKGVASREKPDVEIGPLVENLDELPFAARHLTPMDKYIDSFAFGRSVQVITSRGCIYNCCFCTEPLLYGRPVYRKRSPDNVCDEIEEIIKQYNPDEIYFDDSSFTNSEEHVVGICDEMRKRNLNIQWSCMADAKVAPQTLEIMAKAGCRAIKFGVESADQEVLDKIPKHVKPDDIQKTVAACKKIGIKTHATFMFGLPGENEQKAKKTMNFALSLGTDTAQFSIATPYPGTRFYKQVIDNNWLKKDDLALWGSTAVIGYPDYTLDDILNMRNMAIAKWQRQMALKKPMSVLHYISGGYRRGGISGAARVLKEGVITLVKGLRWI